MKKRFTYGIAVAFFTVVFFSSVSSADCLEEGEAKRKSWSGFFKKKDSHGYGKHGRKHGYKAFWWRDSSMAERLRLKDGQIVGMDEIAGSYIRKLADSYQLMFDAKRELGELMGKPKASDAAIKTAAEKKYQALLRNKRLKLDMALAMRAELTPRQIRELALMKMKNKTWRRGCGKN